MTKQFNDSQNVGKVAIAVDVSQLQWKLVNEKKDVDLRMIAVISNGYHFRYVMPTKGYHLRMITDWVMIEIWGSRIRQGDIVT